MRIHPAVFTLSCLVSLLVHADVTVPMYVTTATGLGQSVGTVKISQTPYGLEFKPSLQHLSPGFHGFHIHQLASCTNNATRANARFDPPTTLVKEQLGGLPALYVNADGTASTPVLAPRYTLLSEIKGRSLIIHEGGDDYASIDRKMGGGIAQKICGVIS